MCSRTSVVPNVPFLTEPSTRSGVLHSLTPSSDTHSHQNQLQSYSLMGSADSKLLLDACRLDEREKTLAILRHGSPDIYYQSKVLTRSPPPFHINSLTLNHSLLLEWLHGALLGGAEQLH